MKKFVLLLGLLTLAFVIGCSSGGTGSGASYQTEEALVSQSFEYMKNLDWDSYAGLMHPMTLDRFRSTIMPGIEQKIMQSTSDSVNILGINFNSEELQNESDSAFFVSMLNMMNKLTPEFAATYQTINGSVVGSMMEGDSLLHVIVRTKMNFGGQSVDEINVQSLRDSDGTWLLEPSNKIEGVAMLIRQALGR